MRRSWVLVIALLLLGAHQACAAPTKLRISLQLPITGHLGVNLNLFKSEVERLTEGALAIEIYDNARLYRDDQALGAVASGAVEMATIPFQQLTPKAPALGILEQPFLFNTEGLVRAVLQPESETRQLLDKAVLEGAGVRVLWWQAYGGSVFFSKGRDARLPGSIAGQKVRVFGENLGSLTRYCGGVPLLISASKMYKMMQDGALDFVMSGVTVVETREFWKVSDTITRTDHADVEFPVIINEKVWRSLSRSLQDSILQAARRAEAVLRDKMAEIEAKSYAFARSKGMTIYELTPDEVSEWRACSANLVDDYLRDAGTLGSELMAAYGKLRTQPCCTAGLPGTFSKR